MRSTSTPRSRRRGSIWGSEARAAALFALGDVGWDRDIPARVVTRPASRPRNPVLPMHGISRAGSQSGWRGISGMHAGIRDSKVRSPSYPLSRQRPHRAFCRHNPLMMKRVCSIDGRQAAQHTRCYAPIRGLLVVGRCRSTRLGSFVWIGQLASLPGAHLRRVGWGRPSSDMASGARSGSLLLAPHRRPRWQRTGRVARVGASSFGLSDRPSCPSLCCALVPPNNAFKPKPLRGSA